MCDALLLSPVLNCLCSMLDTSQLHVVRAVCRVWRAAADARLRRFSTLHWDYWNSGVNPVDSCCYCALCRGHRDECDDSAMGQADRQRQLRLAELRCFVYRVWRACPFRVGHALVFSGGDSSDSALRGSWQKLVCRQLVQLAEEAAGDDGRTLPVFAFDSTMSNECQERQCVGEARVIGTVLTPPLRHGKGGDRQQVVAGSNGDDAGVSVGVVLVRDLPGVRVHFEPVPLSASTRGPSPRRSVSVPSDVHALLLCSAPRHTFDVAISALERSAPLLSPSLALGGGVFTCCRVPRRRKPGDRGRGTASVASVFVMWSGANVRAASCVLHAVSDARVSCSAQLRCRHFIRRVRLLNFPVLANTVALVFGSCVTRRAYRHTSDTDEGGTSRGGLGGVCDQLRRAFPAVPVFGLGCARQVGRQSGMPLMRGTRCHQVAFSRSVVLVLLHVSPSSLPHPASHLIS